ncbi:unnamed protein product [Heligmosomoides polygyrus]|uniref:Transmembrane protein n=1 Tax=Heligmosomoides polygyrus TaxID=6339 RepID=A0A183FHJ0_HELPZ|nr:unnamed protein product [Heligmosomoides polygyrus]
MTSRSVAADTSSLSHPRFGGQLVEKLECSAEGGGTKWWMEAGTVTTMLLIIILIVINTHSGPIMEDTDPDPIMTRADDWNEPARQQIGLQRVPRAWLGMFSNKEQNLLSTLRGKGDEANLKGKPSASKASLKASELRRPACGCKCCPDEDGDGSGYRRRQCISGPRASRRPLHGDSTPIVTRHCTKPVSRRRPEDVAAGADGSGRE